MNSDPTAWGLDFSALRASRKVACNCSYHSPNYLLVGYHEELKVNLFGCIGII